MEKTKNQNSHFQNAAGHSYSNCYGFGVLNALSLVKKAKLWKQVDPQVQHKVRGELDGRETREIKSGGNLVLKVTICFRFILHRIEVSVFQPFVKEIKSFQTVCARSSFLPLLSNETVGISRSYHGCCNENVTSK